MLAAVDGSPISYPAAAWAAGEAALHRRALHILTAALPTRPGPALTATEADLERSRVHAERVVGEAARAARDAGGDELAITTEVSFEAVVALLIERSVTAGMLVVGSHGSGGLHREPLGSVATAVTSHAQCPVAVIHGITAADPVSAARPVLVGVDGTANSAPAVELAVEEASRRRVDLVALHAFSDIDGPLTLGREMTIESAAAELSEALAGCGEALYRRDGADAGGGRSCRAVFASRVDDGAAAGGGQSWPRRICRHAAGVHERGVAARGAGSDVRGSRLIAARSCHGEDVGQGPAGGCWWSAVIGGYPMRTTTCGTPGWPIRLLSMRRPAVDSVMWVNAQVDRPDAVHSSSVADSASPV